MIRLHLIGLALVAAFATGCQPRSNDPTVEETAVAKLSPKEEKMPIAEPSIDVNVEYSESAVVVKYNVHNKMDEPIYLLDELYDMQKETLAKDWSYIEIEDGTATISRKLWPLPMGLRHENPEAPYGRKVLPGESLSGEFSVSVPITDSNPYYHIIHRDAPMMEAKVERIVLELGWAGAGKLASANPVEVDGVAVVYLDYYDLQPAQKVIRLAPDHQPKKALPGRVAGPRVEGVGSAPSSR